MKRNEPRYKVEKCSQMVLIETANGVIDGFTPDVRHMHEGHHPSMTFIIYPKKNNPCCLETKHWEGFGDWKHIPAPKPVTDDSNPLDIFIRAMFVLRLGYRQYVRDVRCSKCGSEINAQEWAASIAESR